MRRVSAEGGFATVIAKGEPDAGTLLVVLTDRGAPPIAYERMPQADGTRKWSVSRSTNVDEPGAFGAYLERRRLQDPDLWIVELDVRNGERLIEDLGDGD